MFLCNLILNQLNVHDLMKNLLDGEQNLDDLPKAVKSQLSDIFECLKKIPMLDILKLIDKTKAEKIFSALDKIVALAHVSQSMGNYFARDDALDPALSTVCQALRGDVDIEFILQKSGGTFQSLAAAFQHLKAPNDKDLEGSTNAPWANRFPSSNFTLRHRPLRGCCWFFQSNGRCSRQGCRFSHKCARCGKKSHGEKTCRSRKRSRGD